MGSAKQGWPVVQAALDHLPAPKAADQSAFLADLNRRLRARVRAVNRLTPTIVEVVIEAPQAAANFEPGEFYRLQNFETLSQRTGDTTLTMEGLALTGAWTDLDQGLVGLIVLEMGGSSDLCAWLKPNEPVILMGRPARRPRHPPAKPCCWRAAASAMPYCSRSAARCAPPGRRCSTSPATRS